MFHRLAEVFLLSICIFAMATPSAFAESGVQDSGPTYYLGHAVNAGKDTGYSEANVIEEDDPHYGWNLGSFFVSGFTSVDRSDENCPVFLKTAGDKLVLWFRLDQNIDALNGNQNLSISRDSNGYDQNFGVQKTDFGRGTLIVRQTNYQNEQLEPQVYTDYLSGLNSQAATQVELFEEGDYEVALDYEIKNDPRHVPIIGTSVLPGYTNYSMRFKFSVRNGNTMVFPFDIATGEELTNTAVTENGFYIDMAKSRYLDVNVERATLSETGDELVEDVRSNAPAEDGKQYTDEGVYTITASNPTTGQRTEKRIYVGDDSVLKAYVTTGYPLDEIRSMVSQGAQIDDAGNIIWPGEHSANSTRSGNIQWPIWSVIICVVCLILVVILIVQRKSKRAVAVISEEGVEDTPQLVDAEVEDGDLNMPMLEQGNNEDSHSNGVSENGEDKQ